MFVVAGWFGQGCMPSLFGELDPWGLTVHVPLPHMLLRAPAWGSPSQVCLFRHCPAAQSHLPSPLTKSPLTNPSSSASTQTSRSSPPITRQEPCTPLTSSQPWRAASTTSSRRVPGGGRGGRGGGRLRLRWAAVQRMSVGSGLFEPFRQASAQNGPSICMFHPSSPPPPPLAAGSGPL